MFAKPLDYGIKYQGNECDDNKFFDHLIAPRVGLEIEVRYFPVFNRWARYSGRPASIVLRAVVSKS